MDTIMPIPEMSRTLSFLDLPVHVRTNIYSLCGFVRSCPIDLSREGTRKDALARRPRYLLDPQRRCSYFLRQQSGDEGNLESFDCFCPFLTLPLLYTCRVVHDDIIPILYGKNRFMIWRPFSQLGPLTRLSSAALVSMTCLQVGLGSSGNVETEKEWAVACKILSTKITPSQLSLSLFFYTRTFDALSALLEPLRTLPKLKHCAIRLYPTFGEKAATSLTEVAENVALEMTETPTAPQGQFSFMRLPKEIRYQILGLTDLITPWDVTQWDSHGMVIRHGRIALREKRCCGKCMDFLAVGCNCRPSGCAYATTCVCYQFPHGLFRANSQLGEEARQVFYTHNRFILSGSVQKSLAFLRTRTPQTVQSIRRLDLQMSPITIGDMMVPMEPVEDWPTLIDFIATHFNLPSLFLTVDAGYAWDYYHHNPFDYADKTADEAEELEMYKNYISPMRQLKGLKSFHVFLSCCHEYEIEAEQEVMGSDYDSSRDGKIPPEERWPQFPHGIPDDKTLQRLIADC